MRREEIKNLGEEEAKVKTENNRITWLVGVGVGYKYARQARINHNIDISCIVVGLGHEDINDSSELFESFSGNASTGPIAPRVARSDYFSCEKLARKP